MSVTNTSAEKAELPTRRKSNKFTLLGRICYEAYANAATGTARWDIAAAAVAAHQQAKIDALMF